MRGDRMPSGTDPGLLRRINAVSIVRDLRRRGVMTLTALSTSTGLSRRTIASVIETLRTDGWVAEVEVGSALRGAGRPARSFRFVAEVYALVGIQIAAHEVFAVVTDLNGSILGKATQDVRSTTSRKGRLSATLAAINSAVSSAKFRRENIRLIAVGTPGIVDSNGYIGDCTALPEWSNFDLAAVLEAEYGCEVTVNNDTNLSAVGERWRGISAGYDSTVWLLTGRRTSMGLIIGNELYRGHDGAAGEIGLQGGPWDKIREHPLSFFGAAGRPAAASADAIIADALKGDTHALELVDSLASTIAQGLIGIVLSLNPACVVLGGALAEVGQLLIPAIESHIAPWCVRVPEVRASSLGTEATAIGAVRVALDAIDEDFQNLWLVGNPSVEHAYSTRMISAGTTPTHA